MGDTDYAKVSVVPQVLTGLMANPTILESKSTFTHSLRTRKVDPDLSFQRR